MDQVLSYAAAARSSKQAPSTNKHFPPGILMTPKTIAENLKSIKEATKALNVTT